MTGAIYNQGVFYEKFKVIKNHNINDKIRYFGIANYNEKRSLLLSADVLALPTKYPVEGQPISIIEGMAAGLPIISSDKGVIPEMISGNGLIKKMCRQNQ